MVKYSNRKNIILYMPVGVFPYGGGGDNIPFQDTFNAFIMDIKPNEFYFVNY